MLNKKKVAAVVAILVVILILIISAIFAGLNKGTKVAKLSKKIEKSQEYLLVMKDENNYEITIAEKQNQTSIDMNNDGEKVTTLVKDGTEYLILHQQREYYTYNSEAEQAIVTDTLKDLGKANSTGKEKINGKTYKYEEYQGFEGFMTSTGLETDEENVSTRFYFKGNNLVYIKTMVEGQDDELLEIKLTYSVPDELFEIPSDYTEASME